VSLYRVFPVDECRHVVGAPAIIDCSDDAAAVEQARKLQIGPAREIWDRERFIALITEEGKVI